MKIINLKSGKLYTEDEFRSLHREQSLPRQITKDVLAVYNCDYVYPVERPQLSSPLMEWEYANPVFVNGKWQDSWREVSKFKHLDGDEKLIAELELLESIEEQRKQTELFKIELMFKEKVRLIKKGYSEDEILSWDQQVVEAKAFLLDATTETPLLDAIASGRGVTKEQLVQRILTNANLFAKAFGKALGEKQAAIDSLYKGV